MNDMDRIVAWCGNLVTLDEEDDSVHFAHHTVKDFLESSCLKLATKVFHFTCTEADYEAGQICVTYLNFSDFERQLARIPKAPMVIQPMDFAKGSVFTDQKLMVSKCYSKVERLLAKRPTPGINVHDQLVSLYKDSNPDKKNELQKQYPFLRYAREHWLSHTSNFSKSTETWKMWESLISSGNSLAANPWTENEWLSGDQKILKYSLEHSHDLLLMVMPISKETVMALSECQKFVLTACKRGHIQLIKNVCIKGLAHRDTLCTLLIPAAKGGYLTLLEPLLSIEAFAAPSADAASEALREAVQVGQSDVVRWLLVHGVQINEPDGGSDALRRAARHGHSKVVAQLLVAGAHINEPEGTSPALLEAAKYGYPHTVELLLAAGATVNESSGCSKALAYAARGGYLQIVDLLLAAGAQVNQPYRRMDVWGYVNNEPGDDSQPLQHAARHGNPEVLNRLLAAGAHVNELDGGSRALRYAAEHGNLDMLDRLLAAGAQVNEPDGSSQALQYAACGGHLQIVDILLAAGAHVNEPNSESLSLSFAAQNGSLEVVEWLLAAGAEFNENSRNCSTALWFAGTNGHLEVVKRLLAAGARLGKSRSGVFQTARRTGHVEVLRVLEEAEAT